MFRDPYSAQLHVFGALARLGVSAGDVRIEQGNGSLGDLAVAVGFPGAQAGLRLMLDRLELQGYFRGTVQPEFTGFLQEVLSIVMALVEEESPVILLATQATSGQRI
ncbi:MAG: hypothetical protein AB1758_01120 [Candidatus Eremiobacterota bacterium]